MPAGSFVLHRQSDGGPQFDFLSRRLLAMLNLERSAVAADPLLLCRCVHPEDFPSIQAVVQEVYANGGPFGWQGRLVVAGETLWVRVEAEPRLRPDGLPAWDGVVTDISEQQRIEQKLRIANAKLEKLAATDALTGAWNRLHFEQRLTEEIERAHRYGQPLSLLLLDIDHFKAINDRYGHPAGDDVLKWFARILAGSVKGRDTVARYGGEEFAVILPATTVENAVKVAARIKAQLEQQVWQKPGAPNTLLRVTASFGVAQIAPGEGTSGLVARADTRLYEAKSGGRNRVAA